MRTLYDLHRKYVSFKGSPDAVHIHRAVLQAKREAEQGIYPVTRGLIRELRSDCRKAAMLVRAAALPDRSPADFVS